VADDHYVIRESLGIILGEAPEVELVAMCSDAMELAATIETSSPQVVVTDIRMPPSGGAEGIRIAERLRETAPEVGVVILSQYAEPAYALGLFQNGTGRRAYLLKERVRDRHELIGAIESVARGGSVIDPAIIDVLIQARVRAAESRLSDLTAREREILAEIATGKSNGSIAEALGLTKRAVEKHVNSILSKLNLPETQDASRRVQATLLFLADEPRDRGVD
jgi:DNA-binding NarL/FixJ family response regulator